MVGFRLTGPARRDAALTRLRAAGYSAEPICGRLGWKYLIGVEAKGEAAFADVERIVRDIDGDAERAPQMREDL